MPKIINTTPNSPEYEIWVVDNASTDGTWDFLDTEFSAVKKLRIEENRGFTNGYVESLSQIKAKYYVLISSDIEVEDNWFLPPIDIMERNEKVAAVQPKIKSYHKKDEYEYAGAAGGYIDHLGYPFCRGRLVNNIEKDHGQYDNGQTIFWASGACLFIRADLYHKAGGLDNDFFAHMEEIDLCWRLNNMGYEIRFCPGSTVYHMGGFIISYGSPAKVFRNHRNNLVMLLKNMGSTEIMWKLPLRVFLDWLTFLTMILQGEWKASTGVIMAHWGFISRFSKWIKKRKQAQQLKTITEKHPCIYPKSVVWQVFVRRVTKFSELNWRS